MKQVLSFDMNPMPETSPGVEWNDKQQTVTTRELSGEYAAYM